MGRTRQHSHAQAYLPLALALLSQSPLRSSGYLAPTGDTPKIAHVGVWPRTHGDLTNTAIKLLEADERSQVLPAALRVAWLAGLVPPWLAA